MNNFNFSDFDPDEDRPLDYGIMQNKAEKQPFIE